jgi:hypothetical protein
VVSSRNEATELREQLATASAKRGSGVPAPVEDPGEDIAPGQRPARKPIQSPPWSALDDELLARIERAKALTGA